MIPNLSNSRIAKLRHEFADNPRADELAELFDLLSNPLRLKIVMLLTEHDELCVSEFSHILEMSMPAVSHALRPLRDADIVATHKLGKQVCYRLIKPKLFRTLTAAPLDKRGSSLALRFWQ